MLIGKWEDNIEQGKCLGTQHVEGIMICVHYRFDCTRKHPNANNMTMHIHYRSKTLPFSASIWHRRSSQPPSDATKSPCRDFAIVHPPKYGSQSDRVSSSVPCCAHRTVATLRSREQWLSLLAILPSCVGGRSLSVLFIFCLYHRPLR